MSMVMLIVSPPYVIDFIGVCWFFGDDGVSCRSMGRRKELGGQASKAWTGHPTAWCIGMEYERTFHKGLQD